MFKTTEKPLGRCPAPACPCEGGTMMEVTSTIDGITRMTLEDSPPTSPHLSHCYCTESGLWFHTPMIKKMLAATEKER